VGYGKVNRSAEVTRKHIELLGQAASHWSWLPIVW
jgi:hypothetical protein